MRVSLRKVMTLIAPVSSTLSEGYPSSTCNVSAERVRLHCKPCYAGWPCTVRHRKRVCRGGTQLAGGHPYAGALQISHNTTLMAIPHCMAWKAARWPQPCGKQQAVIIAGHLSKTAAKASVMNHYASASSTFVQLHERGLRSMPQWCPETCKHVPCGTLKAQQQSGTSEQLARAIECPTCTVAMYGSLLSSSARIFPCVKGSCSLM